MHSRTTIVRPSIIQIFNYLVWNPLFPTPFKPVILGVSFSYPLLSDLIVTLSRGSDNRGSTVLCILHMLNGTFLKKINVHFIVNCYSILYVVYFIVLGIIFSFTQNRPVSIL